MPSRKSPSYLQSEMRRIETPPIDDTILTLGKNHSTRCLGLRSGRIRLLPRVVARFVRRPDPNSAGPQTPRAYMKTLLQHLIKPPARSNDVMGEDTFCFAIPDHLPNSLLCPLRPKNSSQKLMCPMHGRRRSS